MNVLDKIANDLDELDLDSVIDQMEVFKEVLFTRIALSSESFTYDVITFGNDQTGASRKHGIYMHLLNGKTCMYVGKAERQSIAARQTSHFTSFRRPWNLNERTGNKYRHYMETFGIDKMNIQVRYLDMTPYPKYMIPMFELILMDYLNPLLNQETYNL